jgi:quercetin dioxygenase-like cupin family protein
MNNTRRELSILLPALFAQAGQSKPVLRSESYNFKDLPVKISGETHNETRQVFDGVTHDGFAIDLHITQLAPGQMPHPAHHHEWEEMIFVQTGQLEVNIKGKTTHVGPGSVVYVASNEEHGWKNVGDVPSQYFVLAARGRGH